MRVSVAHPLLLSIEWLKKKEGEIEEEDDDMKLRGWRFSKGGKLTDTEFRLFGHP